MSISKSRCLLITVALVALGVLPARAQDRLCDPGDEQCRGILINYIRNETVGIDVAFWFMEDSRYTTELIRKHNAGVPVRVLMDPRANPTYPLNVPRLAELQDAGIPMRKRLTSYILHWKMMLFHGQNVVQFSGANYSGNAWVPLGSPNYSNYIDEAIYFTSDEAIVNSFRTKFDDQWVDTVNWANYANITPPLTRHYEIFPQHPSLNFPPTQNYRSRSLNAYSAERRKIDVIMFRITDRQQTDRILATVARGIPVRLLTEPQQYRDVTRMWHSWNVDRLYMGGVQIKHREHAGLNHQKSVILYDQNGSVAGDQTMVIFGSSNWTSPSAGGQLEHNIFTTKPYITSWFIEQFDRKWNNTGGVVEYEDFVPLPPDPPKTPTPAHNATNVASSVTLRWKGGPWAHLYDVYLGTTPNPTQRVAENLAELPSKTATSTFSYTYPQTLAPATRYYWKVVGKTMAMQTRSSQVWSFTTEAGEPPPTASGEVVLYASEATPAGAWVVQNDGTAAGGKKIRHPNAGGAKLTTALANPTNYFQMTFQVEAARSYRLWIRGRADSNHWANDSVFVQFSGSVTSGGSATWRIGTTSATEINLEDCNGCGVANWGWQDNGWGTGVMGPVVRFAATGTQTIRVQTREDGLAIDQIVLSPTTYLNASPGALKNDTTILGESSGGSSAAPEGEVVVRAAEESTLAGAWRVEPDSTAAGGEKIRHPNLGAAKLTRALAAPRNYFELTFDAEAGTAYRTWIRGRADANHWSNDSVFVQFDGSVNESGAPIWRIGTTAAAEVNLEECSGCGVANWGWQDNGWGRNVLGPLVYFEDDGPQRMRVQTREDGLSIDQIVLSSSEYLKSAPGEAKNDETVLP
jgi:phosphatidylserine/phosphatidylglycerophosphate/cardiolipin synthase-like enzyme